MTKQHIDRLRELLVASKDLTEPMDYFLQHVITDAEIVRASQPAASAILLHVILELVERHSGQELFVLAPFFLQAAAYRLWHGGCHLGGCHLGGYVAHVLFFDDVQTGILSIVRPQEPGSVDYLRFSIVQRAEASARN
jgi:hypothetical protein